MTATQDLKAQLDGQIVTVAGQVFRLRVVLAQRSEVTGRFMVRVVLDDLEEPEAKR